MENSEKNQLSRFDAVSFAMGFASGKRKAEQRAAMAAAYAQEAAQAVNTEAGQDGTIQSQPTAKQADQDAQEQPERQ